MEWWKFWPINSEYWRKIKKNRNLGYELIFHRNSSVLNMLWVLIIFMSSTLYTFCELHWYIAKFVSTIWIHVRCSCMVKAAKTERIERKMLYHTVSWVFVVFLQHCFSNMEKNTHLLENTYFNSFYLFIGLKVFCRYFSFAFAFMFGLFGWWFIFASCRPIFSIKYTSCVYVGVHIHTCYSAYIFQIYVYIYIQYKFVFPMYNTAITEDVFFDCSLYIEQL